MTVDPIVFERDELTIRVHGSESDPVISWHGTSDARDPGAFLNPFLQGLSAQVKGKRVTVDFHEFKYMNSATVSPIINFVRALDAQGTSTRVLYAKDVDWQRLNFQVLGVIATTLKNLRVEGK